MAESFIDNSTEEEALESPECDFGMSEPVLGRITEMHVEPDVFSSSNALLQMTNKGLVTRKYRNRIMVATHPQHRRIVGAVLEVTHPDVVTNPKGLTIVKQLFNDYENDIDPTDYQVAKSLDETLGRIACETDLIKGMCAFAEAEANSWANMYDQLLVRPAMLMAAWMIAHEENEPLQYGD